MTIIQQTKDGLGIHTFMLRRKLTYEEYRTLKLTLQKHIYKRRDTDNDCYIKSSYFSHIGYFGITASLYMQNDHARLELIVNPTNLLNDSYSQTSIFSKKGLCKAVTDKLNDALSNINLTVDFFILSRIDLCVNYIMTPAMVETYIKLGNKSYKAYNVDKKLFEDSESNQHSLTLICKAYEVEIYDKEYEVAKRTAEPLPEGSFGTILRIEARLERDTIKQHIGFPEKLHKALAYFLEEERDILSGIMQYCFYPGTYTTLENALALIKSGSFNQKTLEIIEEILRSKTDISTTLENVKGKYGLSDKALQRIRHRIKKAGVCMATIPVRDAKVCESKYLLGFSDIVSM